MKLEKFFQFAAKQNLKRNTKKFLIGSQVEFGGSVLTVDKVKTKNLSSLHYYERQANKRKI